MRAEFVEHLRFDVAKDVLPFVFEKRADRTANALFDHMIRINKGDAKPPRQLASYGCFAATGQSHQNQQICSQSKGSQGEETLC